MEAGSPGLGSDPIPDNISFSHHKIQHYKILISLFNSPSVQVRMAERSKSLRSGCSLVLQAWFSDPTFDNISFSHLKKHHYKILISLFNSNSVRVTMAERSKSLRSGRSLVL